MNHDDKDIVNKQNKFMWNSWQLYSFDSNTKTNREFQFKCNVKGNTFFIQVKSKFFFEIFLALFKLLR